MGSGWGGLRLWVVGGCLGSCAAERGRVEGKQSGGRKLESKMESCDARCTEMKPNVEANANTRRCWRDCALFPFTLSRCQDLNALPLLYYIIMLLLIFELPQLLRVGAALC